LWLIAVIVCCVGLYQLYCIIVPFQSANPLWHEVTIGENVIGDWKYGGQDEEGYLRFYNHSQTVVLPPSARLFDADGQFVVIERYSPGSLTYALPYEAIPLPWLAVIASVLVAAAAWTVYRRRRRPARIRTRRRKVRFLRLDPVAFRSPRKVRRFRSAPRRWRWLR
jgi:hypothetical protein